MCNDYGNRVPYSAYLEAFSHLKIRLFAKGGPPNLEPRDDIWPTDVAPIIRASEDGAELVQVRWGFPPGRPKAPPVINMRSENRRFPHGRCLVPASHFYEFTGKRSPKDKWRFTKSGEDWFCIAGLWRPVQGAAPAFTMLTCEPGADVAPIHNRQIVVFRQINKQTGNRLRQQLVDVVTGEPVQAHNKGRGYEVGENQFLLVRDDELEAAEQEGRRRPYTSLPAMPWEEQNDQPQSVNLPALKPLFNTPMKGAPRREQAPHAALAESSTRPVSAPTPIENNRTIEIDRFIPRAQVDARYLDTTYYVVPRDAVGEEAFAVIRDAMRAKDVVGMGRVVLARRERPIIVEPMGNGIRGITLRYSHEIRDEASYFAEIPNLKLPEEMLRVAEHIVETKMLDFDPAFLEDRYRTVLISKLKEKRSELPKKAMPAAPSAQNVISLMDVLKRSLAAEQPVARTSRSKTAQRREAAPSRGSPKRSNAHARKTG